jgi:N-acetyl-gamma-glutamyl-phosphate reductase
VNIYPPLLNKALFPCLKTGPEFPIDSPECIPYTLIMHKNSSVRAAVAGASGYTGAELMRYLTGHPNVELGSCLANQLAGESITQTFPNFVGHLSGHFEQANWSQLGREHDVVFLGLPHGKSQGPVKELLQSGCHVIDLGADFRFSDAELYKKTYGQPHECPELLEQAVYGLPEKNREAIQKAQLIANPGCYPTASLLALLPLIESNSLDSTVIVDAKSGVSGAGRSAKVTSLYCEVNENFKAYGVGVHRHGPEIEQFAGQKVLFTPHLVPMTRGILATVYIQKEFEQLQTLYRDFYDSETLVSVLEDSLPSTKSVCGTSRCHLAVCKAHHPEYSIVISAIDNLGKGAAGTAVHNMNLLYQFPERTGLESPALAP